MYEELFHSPDRPFRATPDVRSYFAHETVEVARQTVVRAVLRAEGPVMVLGGAGLGKSLLGMVVAEDLATRFDIVQLHAARLCTRRALLQSILFGLGLPYRDLSEGELRLSILARLEPSNDYAPDGVVIVVDEAHTLSAKLLDELRLITNFTRANQPRARLVLIGNLRLEDTFAEPQLESFNQRLAARCYLQPMNRQQTREYVFHQLASAGVQPSELITEDAINSVYAASDGVPRLVNQIMDHTLALAATGTQRSISSSLIEEAWADLQQLPAPWHAGAEKLSTQRGEPSAIEFGELDSDDWGTPNTMQSNSPPRPSATVSTTPDDAQAKRPMINPPTAFSPIDDESQDESADELRLPDDPMESNASPNLCNYFAAFSEPEGDYCREYADSDDAGKLPSSNSFFRDRPTDEQLLAFQDESQGYDAMGVWENDPPLAGQLKNRRMDANDEPRSRGSNDLFGDGFEEEVSLTSGDAKTADKPRAGSPSSSVAVDKLLRTEADTRSGDYAARQAAEAADYIGRIQQFADSVAADNHGSPDMALPLVDESLAESQANGDENRAYQLASPAALDSWSVDVAPVDIGKEQAVQVEIEDLVSQLNFAAFSVEPFSVEQIDLAPSDHRPHDSRRNGKNDEVYTMHRPIQLPCSEQAGADFLNLDCDDDRDLLVIEEELRQSSSTADARQTTVTKIAPYSQLFAKLRK